MKDRSSFTKTSLAQTFGDTSDIEETRKKLQKEPWYPVITALLGPKASSIILGVASHVIDAKEHLVGSEITMPHYSRSGSEKLGFAYSPSNKLKGQGYSR